MALPCVSEREACGLRLRPGDGESITDLYERVHAALGRYAATGREIVLVAHGGPVRVATTSADPRRREPVPRVTVGNATVTTLERSRCC